MRTGARNQLYGKVTEIKSGDLMSLVKVTLDGSNHTVSSVMTLESLEELSLKKGDAVCVLVKAVNVLLLKE